MCLRLSFKHGIRIHHSSSTHGRVANVYGIPYFNRNSHNGITELIGQEQPGRISPLSTVRFFVILDEHFCLLPRPVICLSSSSASILPKLMFCLFELIGVPKSIRFQDIVLPLYRCMFFSRGPETGTTGFNKTFL